MFLQTYSCYTCFVLEIFLYHCPSLSTGSNRSIVGNITHTTWNICSLEAMRRKPTETSVIICKDSVDVDSGQDPNDDGWNDEIDDAISDQVGEPVQPRPDLQPFRFLFLITFRRLAAATEQKVSGWKQTPVMSWSCLAADPFSSVGKTRKEQVRRKSPSPMQLAYVKDDPKFDNTPVSKLSITFSCTKSPPESFMWNLFFLSVWNCEFSWPTCS